MVLVMLTCDHERGTSNDGTQLYWVAYFLRCDATTHKHNIDNTYGARIFQYRTEEAKHGESAPDVSTCPPVIR